MFILFLISASSTGCLIDNDSDAKNEMLVATEIATGDWEIQLVGWKYNNSVNDVGWRLSDTQGNSIISGTVSGIYGYYQGDGKPVIFIDNDFNGKLSIGDKFGIYPGEDASIDDVTDYTFALEELTTAEWVVSVKLEGYGSSSETSSEDMGCEVEGEMVVGEWRYCTFTPKNDNPTIGWNVEHRSGDSNIDIFMLNSTNYDAYSTWDSEDDFTRISDFTRENVTSANVDKIKSDLVKGEKYYFVIDHTNDGEAQPEEGDRVSYKAVLTVE